MGGKKTSQVQKKPNLMIKYIEEVVEEVLYRLEAYSEDAMALVMRTGMAESGFKTLKQ